MNKRKSNNILLAIKPEFAEKILDGVKNLEFRKTNNLLDMKYLEVNPLNKNLTVYVYESAPTSKIVGRVEFDFFLTCFPDTLYESIAMYKELKPGIDKKRYLKYFEGKSEAFAFHIQDGSVTRFKKPLHIKQIGIKRAPQTYIYLTDDQVSKIDEIQEGENEKD